MKKLFTNEEMETLRSSRYVKHVSPTYVAFTDEFKALVWEQKKKGRSISDIFWDYGIDSDILGEKRIENFCYWLKKGYQTEKEKATDVFEAKYHRPPKDDNASLEKRLSQMEHELAYTRQEVEFLKKIQKANMEAQKQWESKHRQK